MERKDLNGVSVDKQMNSLFDSQILIEEDSISYMTETIDDDYQQIKSDNQEV